MYKKKLGVRVVTAITVGSLLCSNASVAMAAEEVSSIINEHTGDAEKAETSEEEVTETEEVVEETTEAKTEEVVEETTEAETEEVVEETTEAETEEVVEETTEAETDEEELENDFEEVELEAEVALMTAKAPEEELAGVNNEKTIYFNFHCADINESVAGTVESITVSADKKFFTQSELEEYLPDGYTFEEEGITYELYDGNEYLYVGIKKIATKKVYVSYIDEKTKQPFENGIEEIKVAADATSFNTSILTKVPAGYELCVTGDITFEGDTVNVEVRKTAEAAEKTVYVSYIDEETKIPFENGIEVIKVAKDATYFHTSVLTEVPAGYELCAVGDVYIGENDTVNVEVRKKATVEEKTVYVSYIDEETKIPFENGIEAIKVAADATYFNTSVLKEVPAGYELCVVGDVYIGENDTVNVEVRKKTGETPDEKTAVLNVIYKAGDVEVGREKVTATGEEGEAYTFTIKDLTVPAGYALAPSFEDITVEFGASKDVVVEVVEESKVFAANLYVTYKDGDVVVGHSDAVASGLAGGSYIFRIHELKVPEGYVLAEAFNGIEVPYGKTYNIVLQVKKLNPEEMADATLHISYIFNYKEIASEDITVRGKKGESYTFTSENVNLNIPSGYKLKKAMEPTEVQFGETYAITLDLTRRSSGGGSGSSGGGSGSGSGSRSVGTANKLTNGHWILDSVGWWYPFSDNTYAKGGWYYLEWQNKKDWYYFDANGYLVSGWFEENGNKYYLHDVHDGTFGRMYSGWNKIGNQWYYFNDTTTGTFGALDPNAQVPAELLNQ